MNYAPLANREEGTPSLQPWKQPCPLLFWPTEHAKMSLKRTIKRKQPPEIIGGNCLRKRRKWIERASVSNLGEQNKDWEGGMRDEKVVFRSRGYFGSQME